MLLLKRLFGQHDLVDPYSALAFNNKVQCYFLRPLPFLEKERSLDDLPIGLLAHDIVHPARKVLTTADMCPHLQIRRAIKIALDFSFVDQLYIFDIQTSD